MRIISKYKDYYDHLAGIYGIDEKLILDRSTYCKRPYMSNDTKVSFWICGQLVEGLYHDGKFLYGDELAPLASNTKKQGKGKYAYFHRFSDDEYFWYLDIATIKGWVKIAKFPIEFDKLPSDKDTPFQNVVKRVCPNDKYDCPILYSQWGSYEKFPLLTEFDLHKIIPADKLWMMLSEWLGREPVHANNQTDKDKILSHGFDFKSSFRK